MVTIHHAGVLPTTPSFSETPTDCERTTRISVLYIDQAPKLLDLLCRYLEKDGEMMVDTSLSAEDAIEKMRYIAYDVIVTDYYATNGNSLLREVRKAGSQIPFIFFVFFRSDDFESEAKEYGNVYFTEKMITDKGGPFPHLYSVIRAVARHPGSCQDPIHTNILR